MNTVLAILDLVLITFTIVFIRSRIILNRKTAAKLDSARRLIERAQRIQEGILFIDNPKD